MKKEDLVVLKYAPNNCYVQAVDIKDVDEKTFELNLENKVWSYYDWKDVKIGASRSPYGRNGMFREGIIGVYDRNDTKHLDSMVHAAREFTDCGGHDAD